MAFKIASGEQIGGHDEYGHFTFRNYLTAAPRNIVRHKLYNFLSIAGLTVGLTCVIFISLFVHDERENSKS